MVATFQSSITAAHNAIGLDSLQNNGMSLPLRSAQSSGGTGWPVYCGLWTEAKPWISPVGRWEGFLHRTGKILQNRSLGRCFLRRKQWTAPSCSPWSCSCWLGTGLQWIRLSWLTRAPCAICLHAAGIHQQKPRDLLQNDSESECYLPEWGRETRHWRRKTLPRQKYCAYVVSIAKSIQPCVITPQAKQLQSKLRSVGGSPACGHRKASQNLLGRWRWWWMRWFPSTCWLLEGMVHSTAHHPLRAGGRLTQQTICGRYSARQYNWKLSPKSEKHWGCGLLPMSVGSWKSQTFCAQPAPSSM